MIVGKFDLVKFLFRLVQIFQNIRTGNAVLPAQLMDHIKPGFDLLQLVGRVSKIVPGIPDFLRQILHLVHKVCHPLMEGGDIVAEFGDTSQRPLSSCQHGGSTIVWYSLPWSLELYTQTVDRLFRQGQQAETVSVIHITAKDTIDGRIVKALKDKDSTQAALIEAVKAVLQ